MTKSRMEGKMLEQVVGEWTRSFNWVKGYDQRGSGHGVHGAHLVWLVRNVQNPACAVEFGIDTGFTPTTVEQNWGKSLIGVWAGEAHGWDTCVHSPVPQWEDHESYDGCSITGGECFTSTSSTEGRDWFIRLANEGPDWIWTELERKGNELLAKINQEEQDAARFS